MDVDAVHGLLEMVQEKIFVPRLKLVIVVEGDNELVIVPPPETSAHVPLPTVAEFAAIVATGLEIQIVWLGPAFEIVGT